MDNEAQEKALSEELTLLREKISRQEKAVRHFKNALTRLSGASAEDDDDEVRKLEEALEKAKEAAAAKKAVVKQSVDDVD